MSKLSLTIWRVEQTCNFILSWGRGTQIKAELKLFPNLMDYYGVWQQAYLNFYRSSLRGRAKNSGSFAAPPVDWRVRLAQAEANLLSEFHRWLASRELLEIRQQIASVAAPQATDSADSSSMDVCLNCDNLELARLPWETWEIGREFGSARPVRLSRTPSSIHQETSSHQRPGKLRLLAILGDETGLDFKREREALDSLRALIEIKFVGWQQGKKIPVLREEIVQAIADPRGWDILFFAGHSNETEITGGELAIAPNTTILLSEIAPKLAEAKLHGLKFALFNSCKGLSIAEALIDLGLSQVAIMREPIHNAVAQDFLVAFVQALARYEDVHQALRSSCQFLKCERNLTFPSAALIPSLFQHPGATSFRLKPIDFKSRLQRWGPTRREAIAVGGLAFLSLLLPVQRELIEQRLLMQAQFRQWTGQLEKWGESQTSPPVLLIQIDNESVKEVAPVRPLNRSYLSRIITQADEVGIPRLGLDYILDRVTNPSDDEALRAALTQAEQGGMKIIYAVHREDGNWQRPIVQPDGALSTQQLGDILLFGNRDQAALHARMDSAIAEPEIFPFSQMLVDTRNPTNPARSVLQTSWMTQRSYQLGQTWLHPLVDYSLPPTEVYQRIPAHAFLNMSPVAPELAQRHQQVALVAAGYGDAGIDFEGQDNTKMSKAMKFWMQPDDAGIVNGGEVHAYHIHHLENEAFIIPLPDFWLVGLAAILGKWGTLSHGWGPRRHRWVMLAGTAGVSGLVSLQLYITMQILFPWLLPLLTLGVYGWRDAKNS